MKSRQKRDFRSGREEQEEDGKEENKKEEAGEGEDRKEEEEEKERGGTLTHTGCGLIVCVFKLENLKKTNKDMFEQLFVWLMD